MSTTPTQPQGTPSRPRFKTTQDWNTYMQGLQKAAMAQGQTSLQFDFLSLRLACYKEIEAIRKRPLLVYATKFVNMQPLPIQIQIPNTIDLGDVDGFTDLISLIPAGQKSVDVLIHSPGGKPDATERLVYILRNRFEEVHFLIPHSAYSAATMLALSGDTITLHPSATLGPIDPQINGRPARSIKKGFEKVRDQLKTSGPASLPAYIPLLEKLTLDLLEVCEDSEILSKDLVTAWLKTYMLKTEKYEKQIEDTVNFFSDYDKHLMHSRPLVLDKLKGFQLELFHSTGTLSELLWEAYILIDNFFQMSQFVKLFENTYGVSWGRQFQIQLQAGPPAKAGMPQIPGKNEI
jgi:hypothetical protein